ncbi:hypothetical protein ACH5RR_029609 [Cinchona calisaya]|uniref:SWIM-type domain-containing protein n=1 Tax=Cinchona calisaya TaxID=153742 RepID=A0ABD2YS95_9GENT
MLENIRIYLMERLRTKREWISERTEILCPKIQKKLEKAKEDAAVNIARFSGDSKFEVTHMYGEKFVVDLEKCVCDCRRWELTGIPCSHAICCIQVIGEEPERFVNQCYSKDAYVRAYAPVMGPVNGSNAWPDSKKDPIHAPKKLKLPGRPKKARKREPDEQKNDPKATKKLIRVGITHMTCSGCHQKGHTIRKCPQKLPKDDLVPSCSDRGSSINSNKCGRCHVIGHNIRRCPGNQVEMDVNHENSEVPQANVEVANIQLEMVVAQQNHSIISQVTQEVITVPQQNVQPKKSVRCYFCHNIGHNKKTCMSQQAQDWRNRKAEILFPTYVPSRGNRKRTKQTAHRILDEDEDTNVLAN